MNFPLTQTSQIRSAIRDSRLCSRQDLPSKNFLTWVITVKPSLYMDPCQTLIIGRLTSETVCFHSLRNTFHVVTATLRSPPPPPPIFSQKYTGAIFHYSQLLARRCRLSHGKVFVCSPARTRPGLLLASIFFAWIKGKGSFWQSA